MICLFGVIGMCWCGLSTVTEVQGADSGPHDAPAVKPAAVPVVPEAAPKPVNDGDHGHEAGKDDHDHDHSPSEKPVADAHAGHGHAGDGHTQEHDHTAVLQLPIPELLEKACEHAKKTVECDSCRFEIGAVKIHDSVQNLVEVETVAQSPVHKTVDLTGEVTFDENALRVLTPRFSARLVELGVRTGDQVKRGQVLATLESHELAHAVLDTMKRVAVSELAEKKWTREKLLLSRKVGTEQDVQQAEAEKVLAEFELRCARDNLLMFGMSSAQVAQVVKGRPGDGARGRFVLESPLDGVVIQREGIVGEMIPGDRRLLTIADLSRLKALGQVQESYLNDVLESLRAGPITAEVTLTAFPDRIFHGQVAAVEGRVAPETRTLPIRIDIENSQHLVRPGMFAGIRLHLENAQDQVTLPVSAVLEDDGRRFIFLEHGAGLFFRRPVVTGRKIGHRWIIQDGIAAGDRIVTEGSFLMKSDVLREKMGAGCAD
jgi:cobalt-zinc-cadmium efflux system membrane fusion protein